MAYLVDTNVIVRWLLPHDPLCPSAVTAVDRLQGRGEAVYVATQNLIELWSVATRPTSANGLGMTPAEANAELDRIEGLFPLLQDMPTIYQHWRQLVAGLSVMGRQAHDARLAALMEVHAVTHILTFNTEDFRRYPGITAVDPREVAEEAPSRSEQP